MSISLDGFVAGPKGEIDWVFRNRSEASTAWLVERQWEGSLHAMGRLSYESMAGFWPTSTLPFAEPMNAIPKAVFSWSDRVTPPSPETEPTSDAEAAAWESWRNPLVLGADLTTDVRRLKQEDGGPILVHGGATLASSLVAAGLVDEFRFAVHPVALGHGLPIFAGLEEPLHLKLVDLVRFEGTGAVVKIYRPT